MWKTEAIISQFMIGIRIWGLLVDIEKSATKRIAMLSEGMYPYAEYTIPLYVDGSGSKREDKVHELKWNSSPISLRLNIRQM